jgi:hypothetical protein
MFECKVPGQLTVEPTTFAFDEMLKDSKCRAIVSLNDVSHASMAFIRTGVYGDVYQIGVLLFHNDAHFDKVAVHNMGYMSEDSGCIIVGKMVNSSKKPFAAVLNRGIQGLPMVVVGPNRIYYDSLNGEEFKILVPNGYANLQIHPLMTSQPLVEIYCVDSTDKSFYLAN